MARARFQYVVVEDGKIVFASESRKEARIERRKYSADAFIGFTRKQVGERWNAEADVEV